MPRRLLRHSEGERRAGVETDGEARRPSVLVIGAQRSASTFLSSCMRMHPEVYFPKGEVEYFEDPVYERRSPSYLPDLFARAPAARVYGFKRPELLARRECPRRIADEVPAVRLIAVLREPVSRTVSAYFHYAQGRGLPLLPLNDGLRKILDGELADRFPLSRFIVDYSLYGEQIARFRESFSKESMLVLFDRELTGDPVRTMQRVFDFVGVDPGALQEFPRAKFNVGAYSLTRLRYLRRMSGLGYSYRPGDRFGSVRTNRAMLVAFKLAWRFDRMVLARVLGDQAQSLDEDVRSRLVEVFRPDAKRLQTLIGPLPQQWNLP
ncbi:MAG: sulfotransferase domain-containing protein [Actinobacteria bacterium]|nr:sulfotransferase domain-containing protein [Actinomycetota bacterium]